MIKRLVLATAFVLGACEAGDAGLDDIHTKIVADMPSVKHITAAQLTKLESNNVLLLDIRERDEFLVSHLPGAIQINPADMSLAALTNLEDISGKQIIVYCSVGRRSSEFADRLQSELMTRGAVSVSNLEKGAFGWHNERRQFVDSNGPTDAIHPYNDFWKRFVIREEKARYTQK